MSAFTRLVAVATLVVVSGCVLAPRATREERLRAERSGQPWSAPRAERTLPELPDHPTWQDVLRRALVANGDLEAAHYAWRGALARIDVAAAWPNTNTSLGYEYMFSGDNLKAWDRTTISIGFDPMQNLSFPTKAMASGRQALEDARAAGARFVAAKLALQQRVLSAWWEYALLAERLRLARQDETLLALAHEVRAGTVGAGNAQPALIEARVAALGGRDMVAMLEAGLGAARSRLNALLVRPTDAPLAPPDPLPPPRPLPLDDHGIVEAAIRRNPELTALRHDAAARHEAIGRARQEWIPDFNPFAGLTGSVSQVAGVVASLPTRVTMIRGAVAEARAMEARALAAETQAESDLTGAFLAALTEMRDAERRAALWETEIIPAAEMLVTSVRASYEAGGLELPVMIDAERALLVATEALATARTTRETRLAEIEALGGFDVEALDTADSEESS